MKKVANDGSGEYGVIIGWTSVDLGSKLVLDLQSTNASGNFKAGKFDEHRFFLTKSQAAVLANFLYEVSGYAPPRRHRRSWLDKVLAR